MERYEGIVMNAAAGKADPLLFQRIEEKIANRDTEENESISPAKVRKLSPWRRVAAAAIIIMAGLATYLLLTNKHPKQLAKN